MVHSGEAEMSGILKIPLPWREGLGEGEERVSRPIRMPGALWE